MENTNLSDVAWGASVDERGVWPTSGTPVGKTAAEAVSGIEDPHGGNIYEVPGSDRGLTDRDPRYPSAGTTLVAITTARERTASPVTTRSSPYARSWPCVIPKRPPTPAPIAPIVTVIPTA